MKNVSQLEAVGLALVGYTCWVLVDTNLKIAGASRLPAYEVIGLSGLAMTLILLVYGAAARRLADLWPRNPGRQALRSCLDVANNFCVVVALRHLPLALFYILVFAAPLVITLLAAAFLGERLTWRKTLAVATGFLGVVIAVNPVGLSRTGDWTGYLACLVCVSSFSVNMVWSRVLTRTETKESLTFFSGGVTMVVGLCAMLWHAEPLGWKLAGVLGATGLCGVVGSLCFFVALKHASAATVSQYHYSQLLTGAVIAYLIWHERPTVWMVVGAVLIVGAGSYTAWVSRSVHAGVPATGF